MQSTYNNLVTIYNNSIYPSLDEVKQMRIDKFVCCVCASNTQWGKIFLSTSPLKLIGVQSNHGVEYFGGPASPHHCDPTY